MSIEVLCTIVSTAIAVLVLLIDCERTRIQTREQIARMEERVKHQDERLDMIKGDLDKCKSEPPKAECILELRKAP